MPVAPLAADRRRRRDPLARSAGASSIAWSRNWPSPRQATGFRSSPSRCFGRGSSRTCARAGSGRSPRALPSGRFTGATAPTLRTGGGVFKTDAGRADAGRADLDVALDGCGRRRPGARRSCGGRWFRRRPARPAPGVGESAMSTTPQAPRVDGVARAVACAVSRDPERRPMLVAMPVDVTASRVIRLPQVRGRRVAAATVGAMRRCRASARRQAGALKPPAVDERLTSSHPFKLTLRESACVVALKSCAKVSSKHSS